MKNFSKVLGIIAVAVIGFSMAACSMIGGDKGGGFGAPGAPSVKKLPNYTGNFVTSEFKAIDLLNYAQSDINSIVHTAYSQAYDAAFKAKYSVPASIDVDDFIVAQTKAGNSVNYDVQIKKQDTIVTSLSGNPTVNIDASVKWSASTNQATIDAIWNSYSSGFSISGTIKSSAPSGTTFSASTSWKRTAFIKGLADAGDYKVGGYITVEGKYSNKVTKDAKSTATVDEKEKIDSKGVTKISIALTVIDTRAGGLGSAKFRWSYAKQDKDTQRKTTSKEQEVQSDLEVYNNDNVKVYTVQDYTSNPWSWY